jgi:hypothetical protein
MILLRRPFHKETGARGPSEPVPSIEDQLTHLGCKETAVSAIRRASRKELKCVFPVYC